MKNVISLLQGGKFTLIVTDYSVQGGAIIFEVGPTEWRVTDIFEQAFVLQKDNLCKAIAYSRINRVEWTV